MREGERTGEKRENRLQRDTYLDAQMMQERTSSSVVKANAFGVARTGETGKTVGARDRLRWVATVRAMTGDKGSLRCKRGKGKKGGKEGGERCGKEKNVVGWCREAIGLGWNQFREAPAVCIQKALV